MIASNCLNISLKLNHVVNIRFSKFREKFFRLLADRIELSKLFQSVGPLHRKLLLNIAVLCLATRGNFPDLVL